MSGENNTPMTDQELKNLVASLAEKHAALAEAQQETQRQMKETGQFIKEVGRQIGGLGDHRNPATHPRQST
ncbi:MAG: hypothetical protein QOH06_3436 [Acidobacteriota bacterium]|nr:hypothetical protein [Acidobacteriota bacterium]